MVGFPQDQTDERDRMKTKQLTYQDNNPESLMAALVKGNPAGGSITLDQACDRLPNVERRDVIRALKDSNEGVFVVGRKGHASRWVYGDAAEAEAEKFQSRQQTRTRRVPRRQQREVEQEQIQENNGPRRVELGNGQTFTDLSLKVSVAGQVAIIPLKVELVPA